MTDFPAVGIFNTDDTLNEGALRQGLEDVLRASKEFAGASAAVLHQIGVTGATPADTITPASAEPGVIKLQPQTGNDDDLLRIVQTNTRDGQLLYLRVNSDSYNVKLKTGGASPGNVLLLYGDSEYLLNDLSQISCFERQGSLWQEIVRSGLEDFHTVGDPSPEPPFENGWGGTGVKFYKDSGGVVRLVGAASKTGAPGALSVMFTLPVGYRPGTAEVRFPVEYANVVNGIDTIRVASNGTVQFVNFAGITSGTTTVQLYPVAFRTVA